MGVVQHISQCIEPVVSRKVRDSDCFVIQNSYEPGKVSLGRYVTETGRIRSAKQYERAFANDLPAVLVQVIDLLIQRAL